MPILAPHEGHSNSGHRLAVVVDDAATNLRVQLDRNVGSQFLIMPKVRTLWLWPRREYALRR